MVPDEVKKNRLSCTPKSLLTCFLALRRAVAASLPREWSDEGFPQQLTSASETALTSLSKIRLRNMVDENVKNADLIMKLLEAAKEEEKAAEEAPAEAPAEAGTTTDVGAPADTSTGSVPPIPDELF